MHYNIFKRLIFSCIGWDENFRLFDMLYGLINDWKTMDILEFNYRYGYNEWMNSNIKNCPTFYPSMHFLSTFDLEGEYGRIILTAMHEAEVKYAKDLLIDLHVRNIPGAIVEFGVSDGLWLKSLCSANEEIGMMRPVYGFDSFEGLPEPNAEEDYGCWKKGLYACSLEEAKVNLNAASRPYLHLVKGWFCDSLAGKEAHDIKEIAYARLDADLYESTRDCLIYLKDRLVDEAILVFDEWEPSFAKGESKAFYDIFDELGLSFEFLALNSRMHLYFRVLKK